MSEPASQPARTFLITGGAGMIGLAVARALVDRGLAVRVLDLPGQLARNGPLLPEGVDIITGSIMQPATLDEAMQGCDVVIHLAAMLGVQRTEAHPLACLRVNIDGTQRVLDACVRAGVGRIVFASSSEVYGEPVDNPATEHTPTQGRTVYGISKLAGEELCKAYGKAYGLGWTVLRHFNCYGPGQAAQFVAPRFVQCVMRGERPRVFGDGRQMRSYTYVSDTAEATVLAATDPRAEGEVFNVASRAEPVSLVALAERIIGAGGKSESLEPVVEGGFGEADREAAREIHFRWGDAGKIERLLGWRPRIGLDDGLRLTFAAGAPADDWADDVVAMSGG